MKKLLIFFVIALFISVKSSAVSAAATTDINKKPYNEQWTCLDAKLPENDPTIEKFPPPPEYLAAFAAGTLTKEMVDNYFATDPRFIWYNHGAVIRTKGGSNNPSPNSDVYIVQCIQIPLDRNFLKIPEAVMQELGGQVPKEVCTTGASSADMYIWNNDRKALAERIFSGNDNFLNLGRKAYTFYGYYKTDLLTKLDPENSTYVFKSDASGNLIKSPFVYVDGIWGKTDRKLMAYNRLPSKNLEVGRGGDQQGTFTFEGGSKDCVTIAWDPYGRVFDSQTLEPIQTASVTLLRKTDDGIYNPMGSIDVVGGYLNNPQLVKENGSFSFIVPDGIYKLEVKADGYKTPYNIGKININANKIYADLYRGEDIVQKGEMQHRDIPMDPTSGQSTRKTQVKIIGLFQTKETDGTTIVDGSVTHPYALIKAYCKKPSGAKGTFNVGGKADKMGDFKIKFDPYKCDREQGEIYGIIDVEATDLTKSNFDKVISWFEKILFKQVHADSITSYSFDPILNYIEGYAKDNSGNILANAQVGVYGIGDKRPYRTVTTDNNGYYRISSDDLLFSPYELRYVLSNGNTIKLSTSKFVNQNLNTIKKKKVNLFSYKSTNAVLAAEKTPSQPEVIITGIAKRNEEGYKASQKIPTSADINVNQTNFSSTKNEAKQKQTASNMLIIIIIILILLGSTGIILAIYIINKNRDRVGYY